MPAGILLAIAITSEVAATIALRSADGFSRPIPSLIVVAGYALSFWMLSLVLRDISVGTTYAIWAGAGTAAIAVIGIVALGEPATAPPRSRSTPWPPRRPARRAACSITSRPSGR